jgi:nitroimidazol reductase NimA-like FMN-containing flavoprotein (pyridoxamine 5'-phosphate oxidase superfamily)
MDDLTRLDRHPERGSHDPAAIAAVFDLAPFCHLAFAVDGQPFCVPTVHARVGDRLFIHGSRSSRMMVALAGGAPACLTATILDGLVLARGAFYHSMNYRSAMVFGQGEPVEDPDQIVTAMGAMIDRLVPGRWQEVRHPSPKELRATLVVSFPMARASAKTRIGPPGDPPGDVSHPVWAGGIPLAMTSRDPVPAPDLSPDHAPPRGCLL